MGINLLQLCGLLLWFVAFWYCNRNSCCAPSNYLLSISAITIAGLLLLGSSWGVASQWLASSTAWNGLPNRSKLLLYLIVALVPLDYFAMALLLGLLLLAFKRYQRKPHKESIEHPGSRLTGSAISAALVLVLALGAIFLTRFPIHLVQSGDSGSFGGLRMTADVVRLLSIHFASITWALSHVRDVSLQARILEIVGYLVLFVLWIIINLLLWIVFQERLVKPSEMPLWIKLTFALFFFLLIKANQPALFLTLALLFYIPSLIVPIYASTTGRFGKWTCRILWLIPPALIGMDLIMAVSATSLKTTMNMLGLK